MPFSERARRDSWPPTILRIRDEQPEDIDAIDENPFSFFLTAPDEADEFDFNEDLSAGIESTSSKNQQVREVSPSDLQRSPLPLDDDDDDEEYVSEFGIPVSLKDFSRKHTNDGRTSRAGQRADSGLTGLGISLPAASTRGRATIRLTPLRNGKGRGQTRSLSARRLRSWRAPSPDLGPIKEERESDEEGKMAVPAVQEYSASAPATTYMAQAASPKPKKRVHWAI